MFETWCRSITSRSTIRFTYPLSSGMRSRGSTVCASGKPPTSRYRRSALSSVARSPAPSRAQSSDCSCPACRRASRKEKGWPLTSIGRPRSEVWTSVLRSLADDLKRKRACPAHRAGAARALPIPAPGGPHPGRPCAALGRGPRERRGDAVQEPAEVLGGHPDDAFILQRDEEGIPGRSPSASRSAMGR